MVALRRTVRMEAGRLIGANVFDGLDLEALKTAAGHTALALQRYLNADHSDCDGPSRACDCGGEARYASRIGRPVTIVVGRPAQACVRSSLRDVRARSHPPNLALALAERALSPGAVRITGRAAAKICFAQAGGLLQGLVGIRFAAKQAERTAEALGAETAVAGGPGWRRSRPRPRPCTSGWTGPASLCVPSSARGVSASASACVREVKLAVVFSAEHRHPETGRPIRDPGSVTASAATESAAMRDTDTASPSPPSSPATPTAPSGT